MSCFAASSPALAQQATKVPRIAYVWLAKAGPSAPHADAFRQRMAELGWVEGKNIQAEYIDAGGSGAKLDAIMEGLVRDKVDIIVAMCTPEALSAKKFTTTIPVVMAATGDPVAAGLVAEPGAPGRQHHRRLGDEPAAFGQARRTAEAERSRN